MIFEETFRLPKNFDFSRKSSIFWQKEFDFWRNYFAEKIRKNTFGGRFSMYTDTPVPYPNFVKAGLGGSLKLE